MQIAILSDSHGRDRTVIRALGMVRDRGIDTVLHCGDIDEARTVELFRGLEAHFVYGNCDYDREAIREAVQVIGATLHENWGQLERAGRKIAFLHGDDLRLMREVEHSGYFDYLFYGHTHQAKEHRTGPTRVINPGALHRARPKTFLVLDLESGATEQVTVEE
jgi:putative phosphoesterase